MSRTDELRARVESLGNAWEQFKAAKKNELAPTVSLRDYFAAAALPAIIAANCSESHTSLMQAGEKDKVPAMARDAYDFADAMLKARSA